MFRSNERMNLIIEYITSYKEKIEIANKNGLFDTAKMFELFAIEICNVWFGQKFSNLNVETATYPYVDLISKDGELLVQVTTAQNLHQKIKNTLIKINKSKDKKYFTLKKIVFFVLSNKSIDNVKEYSGNDQIGSIQFTVRDNLITTSDIITRAKSDLDFQKKIYKVLKDEFEDFNINNKKFNIALQCSASGLKSIEDLINGEYEINRNRFLETIIKENERYISIQGEAGSGKSVLCKKYVESQDLVLYARAERFIEESHINNIWDCNIEDILKYINGKKIVFFIDALEFIADCAKTKFELLKYLYDIANEHKNVYIVTSCRTSDKTAFTKLETNFSIKIYEVGDITEDELASIMKKYPTIQKMYNMNSYVDLLKSPFYINLIISHSINIDNITDANALRDYIWNKIICLEDKYQKYKILNEKVIETVEKIVFERSKNFLIGINKDNIDRNVMHALLSEGVINKQGEYIRLKYDIFEDICFEHYFDKKFYFYRGDYKKFYDEIEKLGRCVYRRYQIWISNKMFIQENRKEFLYKLTFSDNLPQIWKRQTEIGIVKSKFCEEYFKEVGLEIYWQGILPEFVKNINLFAFEGKIIYIKQSLLQIKLSPIGNGRPCIIQLLKNEEIYKKDIGLREEIVKLCLDYAKQENRVPIVASAACVMMEYYVEYSMQKYRQKKYSRVIDEILSCLEVIYHMADQSVEWIKEFFNTVIYNYKDGDVYNSHVLKEIIEWTVKNSFPNLVIKLGNELCSIVDTLWVRENENTNKYNLNYNSGWHKEYEYGLSENVVLHDYSYRVVYDNVFLINLFRLNFKVGFHWAIEFINKAISKYVAHKTEGIIKIKLRISESNTLKEYWGNKNMWFVGIEELNIPTIIGDIIFCLQEAIIDHLENCRNYNKLFVKFSNYVKQTIYNKSNNIALLTIIKRVGLHFKNELPGYSLDLASSITLINLDILLYNSISKTEFIEGQKHKIFKLSGIKNRYKLDEKCNMNIQEYVVYMQLSTDNIILNKCYEVLDYLYAIIPNDKENELDYLNIQKMDKRCLIKHKITNNIDTLPSQISVESEEFVLENEKLNEPNNKLYEFIKKIDNDIKDGKFDFSSILTLIQYLLKMTHTNVLFQYENYLIDFIAIAIENKELKKEKKRSFVKYGLMESRNCFQITVFVVIMHLSQFYLNNWKATFV